MKKKVQEMNLEIEEVNEKIRKELEMIKNAIGAKQKAKDLLTTNKEKACEQYKVYADYIMGNIGNPGDSIQSYIEIADFYNNNKCDNELISSWEKYKTIILGTEFLYKKKKKKSDDPYSLSKMYYAIVKAYKLKAQKKDAIEMYEKGFKEDKERGRLFFVTLGDASEFKNELKKYTNASKFYRELGFFDEALTVLNEALQNLKYFEPGIKDPNKLSRTKEPFILEGFKQIYEEKKKNYESNDYTKQNKQEKTEEVEKLKTMISPITDRLKQIDEQKQKEMSEKNKEEETSE